MLEELASLKPPPTLYTRSASGRQQSGGKSESSPHPRKGLDEDFSEDCQAKQTQPVPFNFLAASPAPPSAFLEMASNGVVVCGGRMSAPEALDSPRTRMRTQKYKATTRSARHEFWVWRHNPSHPFTHRCPAFISKNQSVWPIRNSLCCINSSLECAVYIYIVVKTKFLTLL